MAASKDNIREKAKKLSKEFEENFPIDAKMKFGFFPFSNENHFSQALNLLKSSSTKESSNAVRVAILFGESRFLSMLPEVAQHADLILLADIEPKAHLHTKHLLQCLFQASTPEEFIKNYQMNNQIKDSIVVEDGKEIILDINFLTDVLTGKQGNADSSLEEFHFLKTVERFNKCKFSASQLAISNIQLDLTNINQVENLASFLQKKRGILTLCNFTNIHDYDDNRLIKTTVPILLKNSEGCFLMYATGEKVGSLSTNITQDPADYFAHKQTYTIRMPTISNISMFFNLDIEPCKGKIELKPDKLFNQKKWP